MTSNYYPFFSFFSFPKWYIIFFNYHRDSNQNYFCVLFSIVTIEIVFD